MINKLVKILVWTVTRILTTSFAIFSRFCLWSSRFFKSLVKILTQSCKMKKRYCWESFQLSWSGFWNVSLTIDQDLILKKRVPQVSCKDFLSQSPCLVSHLFASPIKNSEFKNKQHCTTETYIYIYIFDLLSQDTAFWKKKE